MQPLSGRICTEWNYETSLCLAFPEHRLPTLEPGYEKIPIRRSQKKKQKRGLVIRITLKASIEDRRIITIIAHRKKLSVKWNLLI